MGTSTDPDFPGFPPDFFDFFVELASNNNRVWFADNRDRYQNTVVEPMCAFIDAMAPRLARISPHFVADSRPNGGSMFRIYRDTRFAKDKTPYKTHAACQFRHEAGRDAHAPGFYVHLAPDELVFGGGIWQPPAPALARLRAAIDEAPQAWQRLVASPRFKARFGGLGGDALKRPPRGYPADHRHIEDLKRKSFFAMRHTAPDLALSAQLVDEVAASFTDAKPLIRFISQALGQAC